MTVIIFKTPEGKKIYCNTKRDAKLHLDPDEAFRGEDLLAHKARDGKIYYYIMKWSRYQDQATVFSLLTKEEAEEFIAKKTQVNGVGEEDLKIFKMWGLFQDADADAETN